MHVLRDAREELLDERKLCVAELVRWTPSSYCQAMHVPELNIYCSSLNKSGTLSDGYVQLASPAV